MAALTQSSSASVSWKYNRASSHGVPVSPCFLDRTGCYQRGNRHVAVEVQQRRSTGTAGTVCTEAGKALRRGVFVTLVNTKPRDQEARRLINEHKTIASIDKQVDTWHATQPKAPDPIIVEHPGGGMSIHAPWKRDH